MINNALGYEITDEDVDNVFAELNISPSETKRMKAHDIININQQAWINHALDSVESDDDEEELDLQSQYIYSRMKEAIKHSIQEPIKKGDVVIFENRWYSVSAVFKKTCNLASSFGSKIIHKQIMLCDVKEDRENWWNNWTQSETYRSM